MSDYIPTKTPLPELCYPGDWPSKVEQEVERRLPQVFNGVKSGEVKAALSKEIISECFVHDTIDIKLSVVQQIMNSLTDLKFQHHVRIDGIEPDRIKISSNREGNLNRFKQDVKNLFSANQKTFPLPKIPLELAQQFAQKIDIQISLRQLTGVLTFQRSAMQPSKGDNSGVSPGSLTLRGITRAALQELERKFKPTVWTETISENATLSQEIVQQDLNLQQDQFIYFLVLPGKVVFFGLEEIELLNVVEKFGHTYKYKYRSDGSSQTTEIFREYRSKILWIQHIHESFLLSLTTDYGISVRVDLDDESIEFRGNTKRLAIPKQLAGFVSNVKLFSVIIPEFKTKKLLVSVLESLLKLVNEFPSANMFVYYSHSNTLIRECQTEFNRVSMLRNPLSSLDSQIQVDICSKDDQAISLLKNSTQSFNKLHIETLVSKIRFPQEFLAEFCSENDIWVELSNESGNAHADQFSSENFESGIYGMEMERNWHWVVYFSRSHSVNREEVLARLKHVEFALIKDSLHFQVIRLSFEAIQDPYVKFYPEMSLAIISCPTWEDTQARAIALWDLLKKLQFGLLKSFDFQPFYLAPYQLGLLADQNWKLKQEIENHASCKVTLEGSSFSCQMNGGMDLHIQSSFSLFDISSNPVDVLFCPMVGENQHYLRTFRKAVGESVIIPTRFNRETVSLSPGDLLGVREVLVVVIPDSPDPEQFLKDLARVFILALRHSMNPKKQFASIGIPSLGIFRPFMEHKIADTIFQVLSQFPIPGLKTLRLFLNHFPDFRAFSDKYGKDICRAPKIIVSAVTSLDLVVQNQNQIETTILRFLDSKLPRAVDHQLQEYNHGMIEMLKAKHGVEIRIVEERRKLSFFGCTYSIQSASMEAKELGLIPNV